MSFYQLVCIVGQIYNVNCQDGNWSQLLSWNFPSSRILRNKIKLALLIVALDVHVNVV